VKIIESKVIESSRKITLAAQTILGPELQPAGNPFFEDRCNQKRADKGAGSQVE